MSDAKLFTHTLQSRKAEEFINITRLIEKSIEQSDVKEGIVIIFCPHTTAGITINENADPDVTKDIIYALDKIIPVEDSEYRHYEGNSHAHLKASYMGLSCTVIIHEGRLLLGTWQGIYFCEFDGPRNRTFHVKVIEE